MRFRWLICVLLFLVTVNNYMDRQIFSIAAPVISAEYGLRAGDVAAIANAFLLAYTFGQLFAGMFVDRIGARNGLTLAVVVWSLTAAFTGAARKVWEFCAVRFVLGTSEAVNYPGGVKVAAEWFPPKELATAVGIIQSGSSVGAMISPALAAFLIVHFGWRTAFLLVALPGFLWIPFWRKYYRPLAENPKVSPAEREYIASQRDPRNRADPSRRVRWSVFLRHRAVWGVALARFFEEPAGWFYFTWLPLYMRNDRALSLINTGMLLIIPFLTFDVGKLGGGWASSQLMNRGWPLDRARKSVMLISAIALMASIPAVLMPASAGFILLISIATFGHGCWATTTQTIPGDIVAPAWVGSVYGITACGGGLGAMIFMWATGRMVDAHKSFKAPFVVAGILPILGYLLFVFLVRTIKPLSLFDAAPVSEATAGHRRPGTAQDEGRISSSIPAAPRREGGTIPRPAKGDP